MAIQNIGSDMTFIDEKVKMPVFFRVGGSASAHAETATAGSDERGVHASARQLGEAEPRRRVLASATTCSSGADTSSTTTPRDSQPASA
jgi:hypothetical protein